MIVNNYKKIINLRRKVVFLILLVLFLLYILKVKFDSERFILDENKTIYLENLDKDKEISYLKHKLDSLINLNKPIFEKKDTDKKINTKKEIKINKEINDTIDPITDDNQKSTIIDTIVK